MGNVDLRKINLRTEEDVQEFLEVVVRVAPQLVKFIKDQKLKRVSLQNQVQHLRNNPVQPDSHEVLDDDASVLKRITGQNRGPVKSKEDTRLEQMKAAAQSNPKPAEKAVDTGDNSSDLPPAPVAPGEIGQLNVPEIDGHAPDAKAQAAEQELPADGGSVSEEEAVAAGGSKSEHPSDDGVQPESTLPVSFTTPDAKYETNLRGTPPEGTDYFKDGEEISEADYRAAYEQSVADAGEDQAAPDAPVTGPTEEDKTPIGAKVAKKQKASKKK